MMQHTLPDRLTRILVKRELATSVLVSQIKIAHACMHVKRNLGILFVRGVTQDATFFSYLFECATLYVFVAHYTREVDTLHARELYRPIRSGVSL